MAGMAARLCLLPLLLLLLHPYGASSVAATCEQTMDAADAEALLEAKAELLDPQNVLATWQASDVASACCWDASAITCDFKKRSARVTVLDLSFKGLGGTLPTAFGKLSELTSLSLATNSFAGPIPETWGNLTKLTELDLSYNQLTGALPPAFGKLAELTLLQLFSNSLEGPIPEEWGNLTKLTTLDLSYNLNLNGSLEVLGGLISLQGLTLGGNSFTGDLDKLPLGKLKALAGLDLSSNAFTGVFPPWLKQLRALQTIDLRKNNLSPSSLPQDDAFWPETLEYVYFSSLNLVGHIPSPLCSRQIAEIDLSSNGLNGSFPNCTSASLISKLDFSSNSLTGVLPANPIFGLGNFGLDCKVNVSHNQLSGGIFKFSDALCSNSSFEIYLDLSHNSFTGGVPSVLGNCTGKFGFLSLGNNTFKGSIPESLFYNTFEMDVSNNLIRNVSELTKGTSLMETLRLRGNRLTEFNASGFTSLKILDVGENMLTSAPISIEKVTLLRELYLDSNNITDISEFFVDMPLLSILDLSNNEIPNFPDVTIAMPSFKSLKVRGNLLSSLSKLSNFTQLENLDVGGNKLTTVPAVISNLNLLQTLYLDNNNITGGIPAFIGNISFLQALDLSNNPLTGSIPDTFASDDFYFDESLLFYKYISFIGLTHMNLSHCQLNGNISSKFGNLKRLESLDLSANGLSGELPDLQNTRLQVLNLSQNALTGIVTPSLGNLSLNSIDLSGNSFFGILPAELTFNKNLSACDNYLPGNQGLQILCVQGYIQNNASPPPPPPSPPPPSPPPARNSDNGRLFVIILVVVGVLVLIGGALLLAYICLRPKKSVKSQFAVKLEDHFVKPIGLQSIREATDNFSEDKLLGQGGYGSVYKGDLKNGEVWAVKRATTVSLQGLQIFQNEVDIISRMNHKNLVKLLGFCDEDNEQILIYEFVENGTLSSALRLKEGGGKTPLTFTQRLGVALGAAEGLAYLHTQAKPAIIHRDVKSDNILLDAKLQAKVADFGLLKDNEDEEASIHRTRVAGTHGYMDCNS